MSTLNELFAKDPLQLTKQDRSELVAYYRKARETWKVQPKRKAPTKRKLAKSQLSPEAQSIVDNIKVDLS